MAMFNSYVKLPEGISNLHSPWRSKVPPAGFAEWSSAGSKRARGKTDGRAIGWSEGGAGPGNHGNIWKHGRLKLISLAIWAEVFGTLQVFDGCWTWVFVARCDGIIRLLWSKCGRSNWSIQKMGDLLWDPFLDKPTWEVSIHRKREREKERERDI